MAKIVGSMDYSWESQACQYPVIGEPGIHLEQHTVIGAGAPTVIDCLLARNPAGELIGIFNHYNEHNLFQKAGSCNLWVRPDCQRQGVATDLLREADQLWDLLDDDQTYTMAGNAWIEGLMDKGKIDSTRTGSLEDNPQSLSALRIPHCD